MGVVVSHYGVWWTGVFPWAVGLIHLSGHLGVESFFVLSGFLIGGILLRDRPDSLGGLARFWTQRALRTMPLFALVVVVYAAVHPPKPEDMVLWRYLTHTAFMPLIGQNRDEVWLSVSWSLAVEEWAYFLIPACIVIATCRGVGMTPVLSIVLTILLCIRWTLVFMGLPPADLMLGTPFRMDPIVWGMLASVLSTHVSDANRRILGFAGIVLGLNFCVCWLMGFNGFVSGPWFETLGWTSLDIGLAAFICFLVQFGRPSVWVAYPVQAMAAISYPVYLVHLLFARALGAWPVGLLNALLDTLVALSLTLVVSLVLHCLVERPCMQLGHRLRNINTISVKGTNNP